MRRDVVNHNCIRSNSGSISNFDWTDYLGARANEHIVANSWAFSAVGTDRDLVFDINIRSPPDHSINDNPSAMDENKSRSKFRATTDNAVAEYHICLVQKHFQRFQMPAPRPLHEPVKDHRRSSVREKHFEDC